MVVTPHEFYALEDLRNGSPRLHYTDPVMRSLWAKGLVRWNGARGWVIDTMKSFEVNDYREVIL